jgi:hypothetical protein
MKHALQAVIGTAFLFVISYAISPKAHAEPVDLYSVPHMEPERVPQYSVLDATTVRNEKTGMISTLLRYEPRPDTSLVEGRKWLADTAYQNLDPRLPVFLPLQCKKMKPNLQVCEDIVMVQLEGQSIGQLGIVSGMTKEIQIKEARVARK